MPKTTVIKIGGALAGREDALEALWSSVAKMIEEQHVIVVHGGGPIATHVARSLGHEPRMVHGRRVTSDMDLRIVQWTMRGELNSRLVAHARRAGVRAVGISGADGAMLVVVKRPPWMVDGEQVDFGWVGDIAHVDASLLNLLTSGGYVPVVAPLGIDEAGLLYNVNADTVSCALAAAVDADEYLLVTDSGGVRREADEPASHLHVCSRALYDEGIEEGWIQGGMRVKLKVAFDAVDAGVPCVRILSPEDLSSADGGTRVVGGGEHENRRRPR